MPQQIGSDMVCALPTPAPEQRQLDSVGLGGKQFSWNSARTRRHRPSPSHRCHPSPPNLRYRDDTGDGVYKPKLTEREVGSRDGTPHTRRNEVDGTKLDPEGTTLLSELRHMVSPPAYFPSTSRCMYPRSQKIDRGSKTKAPEKGDEEDSIHIRQQQRPHSSDTGAGAGAGAGTDGAGAHSQSIEPELVTSHAEVQVSIVSQPVETSARSSCRLLPHKRSWDHLQEDMTCPTTTGSWSWRPRKQGETSARYPVRYPALLPRPRSPGSPECPDRATRATNYSPS